MIDVVATSLALRIGRGATLRCPHAMQQPEPELPPDLPPNNTPEITPPERGPDITPQEPPEITPDVTPHTPPQGIPVIADGLVPMITWRRIRHGESAYH